MSFDVSSMALLNRGMLPEPGRTVRLSSGEASFADTLKEYVQGVAEMSREADMQIESLSRGEATDPHQIMLAVEEANLALDLLIEIRNKLLDAYQELARTPI